MEQKRFDPSKLDRLNHPDRIHNFPILDILNELNIDNPKTILDIGVGTAFYSKPVAEKFPDALIYAADISDVMIEWMEKHVVPDYPNIKTLKLHDHQIPLADESNDFIFMVNLHHELDDPALTLNECYRLLKPGGFLAISDWRKEYSEKGPSIELRYEIETVINQMIHNQFLIYYSSSEYPDNFVIIGKKPNLER